MAFKRESSKSDSESDSLPLKKVKSEEKTSTAISKQKWTNDEIELLCALKDKGLSWDDICKKPEFQGRTKNAISIAYKRKVQEAQESFTPEIDDRLKYEYENYQKKIWVHIGQQIGMSPNGCKKRIAEKNYFK